MVYDRKLSLSEKGQSTVEYVLLLLVISTLAFAVFNSQAFKDLLGEDSKFFASIVSQMEYAYRHGRVDKEDHLEFQNHDTFYNKKENRSRFFSPIGAYPK